MARLRIAFPYLLFAAMAAGVYWSNVRSDGPPPDASRAAATDPKICPTCGMRVAAGDGVRAEINGRTQRFCTESCRERFLSEAAAVAGTERRIDPVCKMEVNTSWGFSYEHHGSTIYFCAERCREQFAADSARFSGHRCLVCDQPVETAAAYPATYLDRTYYMCSPAHRSEFKADPAAFFIHRMWGIPDWLYYVSIAAVLLVSFLMFEGVSFFRRRDRRSTPRSGGEHASITSRAATVRERKTASEPPPGAYTPGAVFQRVSMTPGAGVPVLVHGAGAAALGLPVVYPDERRGPTREPRSDRLDLMRFRVFRTLLRSRVFRFVVQLVTVLFFVLIIAAGLFGNQNPGLNIAPLLTWTIWWGGLVVLIMFAGKAWCYMCPWDAIAGWTEKLSFFKKKDDGAGLNLRWPRIVRNIWIATILFVGLTWVEIGFGVTMKPAATAWLALGMLLMAVVSAFLFDRKSFCRYGCLVGRVSGLYALFSGVEIRRRDAEVCRTCRTKECVRGSATAYGCPTYEYPGGMQTNTYCIQCSECLQACPKDNLAVNLRPWGEDLKVAGKPRRDEAYLALLMLALTGFHGLTMTPVWQRFVSAIEAWLPLGRIAAFSLGMGALMAGPVLIYAVLVWVSYLLTTGHAAPTSVGRQPTYFDYFIRYAYCVLPIALFYHLAHNLEHLLMEGQKLIALLSDPFGWGWNVFGTADWIVPPLVSLDVLWILQVVLVGVGHVYSLWAASKITRRLFAEPAAARRGQWPLLVGMIAFSVFSLWLLKQPMEMRTSAM